MLFFIIITLLSFYFLFFTKKRIRVCKKDGVYIKRALHVQTVYYYKVLSHVYTARTIFLHSVTPTSRIYIADGIQGIGREQVLRYLPGIRYNVMRIYLYIWAYYRVKRLNGA